MSWASLVTAGLRMILAIVNWLNSKQLMDAGQDKAVAEASLRVLEATNEGKRLREMIRLLDQSGSDKLWDEMGNA